MSTINLLPEDYIEGRLRRRANVVCFGLFAIVMAGVGGATVVCQAATRNSREVERRVQAEYEDAARLIAQMQQLQTEKQRLNAKAVSTAPLLERIPRSTLLAVIAKSLPKGASITRMDLETRKSNLAEDTGASKPTKFAAKAGAAQAPAAQVIVGLKITGLAGTDVEVAKLMAALTASPIIRNVDLVYSQEKRVTKDAPLLREFQVRAELDATADALAVLEPTTRPADAAAAGGTP